LVNPDFILHYVFSAFAIISQTISARLCVNYINYAVIESIGCRDSDNGSKDDKRFQEIYQF